MVEALATVAGNALAVDGSRTLYTTGFWEVEPNGFQPAAIKVSPDGVATRLPVTIIWNGTVATSPVGYVYFGQNGFCGGRFCNFPSSYIQRMAPDGTVSPVPILASSDGSSVDFGTLSGLAVDNAGNVYFSDSDLHVVRKVTPAGDVTTVGGALRESGETDGAGRAARFAGPMGLAIDDAGYLYVADSLGNTIRRISPGGQVTTIAGRPFVAGNADGPANLATFDVPLQVAVDNRGNVYVADFGNALVRRITPSGVVTTVAGTRGQRGFQPGIGPSVIDPPLGVAAIGNEVYFTMSARLGVVRNVP